MNGFLQRRHLSAMLLTTPLVRAGRALAGSVAGYAPTHAHAVAVVTRGSRSACVRFEFDHEATVIRMMTHDAAPPLRCCSHTTAIHGSQVSVDGAFSERLVKRPLEAEGALRLLQYRRSQAFLFDDHDDSLIVVALSARTAPKVRARFWLEGARLQAAGVSTKQQILLGWDNRHQNVLAFDLHAGKVVSTARCKADQVAFSF